MTRPLAIYVDIDDVLARTIEGLVRLLYERTGRRVPVGDIRHFDLRKPFGLSEHEHESFMEAAHEPAVLGALAPYPGCGPVLRGWSEAGYAVEIVTGRPPAALDVSRRWLERLELPHDSLESVDKYGRHPEATPLDDLGARRFALAVEDSLTMAEFLVARTGTPVVLVDQPWNRDFSEVSPEIAAQITRVSSWTEIAARFAAP